MEWHQIWAERDWKNAKGDTVLHGDLIRYILALLVRHPGRVTFVKVKGHSGDAGNDMADSLEAVYRRDWPKVISPKLTVEEKKAMLAIIARAFKEKSSILFREPVDPVKLNIPSYFDM